MSISMWRERRRPERQDDRVGLRGVGDAVGGGRADRCVHALDQLVGARLLERHAAGGDRGQPLGVVVDAQHASARGRRTRARAGARRGRGRRSRRRGRDAALIAPQAIGRRGRGGARPTAGRSRRRSAGCGARSAATDGAAPGPGGTATRARGAASSAGACGTSPAWKSNAAPTPTSTGASRRSRIAAIHFSCFGTPIPTHTTSGLTALMRAATSSSSSLGERAERRRVATGELQLRMAVEQVGGQLRERLVVASAVEVEALAAVRGAGAGTLHQLGSVDARVDVVAELAQRPRERLPVGHGEGGAVDRLAQRVVVARFHHRVDCRDAQVLARAELHRRVDPVERAVVVGDRERDAEDRGLLDRRQRRVGGGESGRCDGFEGGGRHGAWCLGSEAFRQCERVKRPMVALMPPDRRSRSGIRWIESLACACDAACAAPFR